MLIAKYDYETDIRVQREEAQQETVLGSILNVMDSLDLTLDQAMNVLKISDDEKLKYEGLIKGNKAVYDVCDER